MGLLVTMIRDYEFLKLIIEDLKPEYIDSGTGPIKILKMIQYLHATLKKPLTIDIVRNQLHKLEKEGLLTEPQVSGMNELLDLGLQLTPSEIDYVKAAAFEFIKRQIIAKAVSESIELLEKNHLDSVYDKIISASKKTLNTGNSFGYNYVTESVKLRYENPPRLDIWESPFPSLNKHLDGGFAKGESYSILASTGRGKCLGFNTLLIMADGSTKFVQDVRTGDKLMGPDGSPRTVLSTTKGRDMMYKVTPQYGESYVVNSDHLISLKHEVLRPFTSDGIKFEASKDQIIEIRAEDLYRASNKTKQVVKAWRPGQLEFSDSSDKFPVIPYLFGNLIIGTQPAQDSKINKPVSRKANNATNLDSAYKVLSSKTIPEVYKKAKPEYRLQLLAGMIDRNLVASRNGFIISNADKRLMQDVRFICMSLGFFTTLKEVKGKWELQLTGEWKRIPVRNPNNRKMPVSEIEVNPLSNVLVYPVGEGDYYGFELDGDKRFLLGDFQVTHNTALLCNLSTQAQKLGKNVLFLTLEMSEGQISQRHDSILSGFSCSEIASNKEIQHLLQQEISKLESGFYIKYFPANNLTINGLDNYIERFSNEIFVPDVVILDWLGLIAPPKTANSEAKRHELVAEIAQEFTNLTRKYKFTGITSQQTNRSAAAQSTYSYDAVSESFASLFSFDAVIGLGASEDAKNVGKRYLKMLKNRFGNDGVTVNLIGDLPGTPLTFRFREETEEDALEDG